ncbi:MAG: hypothetical protein K2X82_15820 [Gemmataceae bacterium]|nr:hypothetical protein [Gemmataceae bacterium]
MIRVPPTVRLWAKQLKRLPMNLLLRDVVRWAPQPDPGPGYTVVIACMESLAPVVAANLRLCARQAGPDLREVILVFDCPPDRVPAVVAAAAREVAPAVRVRLLGYDRRQYRAARRIHWGWVYAWLSWSLGIAAANTRAVLIHDMDALPVAPGLFDRLYAGWAAEGAEFCGIRRYAGNGVTPDMGLVTTFELTLDAGYVRRTFRPFDLFNKLRVVDGRVVDFDTMLYAQWRSPRRVVRPIDEDQLVHPSQLICQYTDLTAGRTDFRGRGHMLPVLAYYMHLGGDPGPITAAGPGLADPGRRAVPMFGREVGVDGVPPGTWAWMEKQIRRVEHACFGATRPEVGDYLRGFVDRAGSHRTVGRETGPAAVPDR